MANNIIVQFSESEFRELLKDCVSEGIKESGNNAAKKEEANKLLSISEAASFLNLAIQTLYGFTSNRTIPFIKRGKKLYFKKSELELWLAEGRKATKKEIEESV
jgi:excisionase family DNA binding protein